MFNSLVICTELAVANCGLPISEDMRGITPCMSKTNKGTVVEHANVS